MPRVTRLAAVRRRSGWTEVEVDGAPDCRLPDEEVLRLGLRKGAALSAAALREVRVASVRAEAMRLGLRYLAGRPRSRREVERRLRRARIPEAGIAHAIERCAALGYVDDAAFAAAYARDRIRTRPCGRRRLRADLAAKGVAPGDADRGIRAAFAEEEVTEEALLAQVAAHRSRRLAGLDAAAGKRRLFGYLARRGFDGSAIREWLDAQWPADDALPDESPAGAAGTGEIR